MLRHGKDATVVVVEVVDVVPGDATVVVVTGALSPFMRVQRNDFPVLVQV